MAWGTGLSRIERLTPTNSTSRSPVLSRLWVKLLAGFMLVAIVAVGVVAVLVNRTTTRQFEIYVSQGKQARAEQLAPAFATYYAQTGGWTGVGWSTPATR